MSAIDEVENIYDEVLPKSYKHLIPLQSEEMAVESAIKFAIIYKSKLMGLNQLQSQYLDVIHFENSYHYKGFYGSQCSNSIDKSYMHKLNWTCVSSPYIDYPMDVQQIEKKESKTLEEIQLSVQKGNVAAIILEPIQSHGGNNVFRKEFILTLKQICLENDLLLIFDETESGGGSTGYWWAFNYYDVQPDILIWGKKMQTAGVAINETIDSLRTLPILNQIQCYNSSNIMDILRFNNLIKVVNKNKSLNNAATNGGYLLAKIRELESVSGFVSNSRGIGTLIAFDLPNKQLRDKFLMKISHHMLVSSCGESSVKLRPTLDLKQADADIAIELIDKAIKH